MSVISLSAQMYEGLLCFSNPISVGFSSPIAAIEGGGKMYPVTFLEDDFNPSGFLALYGD